MWRVRWVVGKSSVPFQQKLQDVASESGWCRTATFLFGRNYKIWRVRWVVGNSNVPVRQKLQDLASKMGGAEQQRSCSAETASSGE